MSASVKHTHPSSSKQRHVRVASWQDIHHYEEEEGDGEEVYALEKTKAVKYSFSVKDFRKLGGDDKVLEETIKDPRLKAVIKKKLSSQEKPLSLSESGFTARSRTPSQSSKRSMKKPSLVVGSSRASSTAPKTINENDNYYGDDEDADNTDYPDSLLFPGYSFETDLLSSAFGMAIDPTINAPQLIERLDDSQKQAFESYVEKKYRFGSRFSKFKSKTEMKLVKDRYQKKRFLDKLKTALQSKQTELKKLQTSLSEQKVNMK